MSIQALFDVWPLLIAVIAVAIPAITSHVRVRDLLSNNSWEKREARIKRDTLHDKLLEDMRKDLSGLGKAMRQSHAECREDLAELRSKVNGKALNDKTSK